MGRIRLCRRRYGPSRHNFCTSLTSQIWRPWRCPTCSLPDVEQHTCSRSRLYCFTRASPAPQCMAKIQAAAGPSFSACCSSGPCNLAELAPILAGKRGMTFFPRKTYKSELRRCRALAGACHRREVMHSHCTVLLPLIFKLCTTGHPGCIVSRALLRDLKRMLEA